MKITLSLQNRELFNGNKIAAIKAVRGFLFTGLREAKDAIEACAEQGQPQTVDCDLSPEAMSQLISELLPCGIAVDGAAVAHVSDEEFLKRTLYRAVSQRRWRVASQLVQLLSQC